MAWQVEYRLATEEGDEALLSREWTRVPDLEADFGDVTIAGLEHDAVYEVRVREVVGLAVGPWVYAAPAAASYGSRAGADGVEIPPPPPRNVRIEKDGCLYWDYLEGVPDLAGFEIRHAVDDYRNFGDAQPAHIGLVAAPPYELCGVPRGLRTIMVRAVNVIGVASEPVVAIVQRGPFDDAEATTVEQAAEAPAFLGTVSGGTWSTDTLTANPSDRYWPTNLQRPYWPQDLADAHWANVSDDLAYVFDHTPETVPGLDEVVSLAVTASGRNWTVFYRRMDQAYWPENLNDPYWPLLGNHYWPPLDLTAPHWEDDDELYWPVDLSAQYWPDANRPWPGRLVRPGCGPTRFEVRIPGGGLSQGTITEATAHVSRPTPAAPADAPVVLTEADADVPGGRVLEAGDGLVASDGGAGGSMTLHAGSPWTHDLVPSPITVTNVEVGVVELDRSRLKVDLTRATEVRLLVDVSTAATGARVKAQYSTDEAAWSDLGLSVSIGATGLGVSAWDPMPGGALADVFLRAATFDGDGSSDPVLDRVTVQVR